MMTRRIGEAHRAAGRPAAAIRSLSQARDMFAALPDQANEARAIGELGRAQLLAGNPDEAERLITAALDVMIALESRYEQASIHLALADAAEQRANAGDARRHRELALVIYDALGLPEAEQVRRALSGPGHDADHPGPGSAPAAGQ
jgi:hypothetical protein